MTTVLCDLENVTADGEVSGQVQLINGVLTPVDWREIHLTQYYCECGQYFNSDELMRHLGLEA